MRNETESYTDLKKLAIGTATFGMNYGTFNSFGQIDTNQANQILALAIDKNIDTIDTAISYGESEKVLGSIGVQNWKIISKIPPVEIGTASISQWVDSQVNESLKRLNIPKIYALLLHQPEQLRKPYGSKIWSALCELKKQKRVSKIGYSIYDPSELDDLWTEFKPDIIQAPFNLIDRRMLTSGWLNKLHDRNCEVHVRSVFLQGLLLSKTSNMPKFFKAWSSLWDNYIEWQAAQNISPLEACMGFVLSFPQISKIIVGVDSLRQFEQVVNCKFPGLRNFPEEISTDDINLINPRKWEI